MSSNDVPRQRTGAALISALAVGALAVGLSVAHLPRPAEQDAQPAAAVSTPSYSSSWIAIDTAAPAITLNNSSGPLGVQTLAEADACGMNQGAVNDRFVSFSGSTNATANKPSYSASLASFSSNSIGVKEKKSGTSCYQVNTPSESLQIQLGNAVPSTLGTTGPVASSASLDVELKQDAQLLATTTLDGQNPHWFRLLSGSSTPVPLPSGVPAASVQTTTCNLSADSGSDNGTNDNCRWDISMPSWAGTDDGVVFDTITIVPLNGQFSLEGGSDGAVSPVPLSTPNASIIEIVDGTLACGDSTRQISASSDGSPQVQVHRLATNADGTACQVVPYSLSTDPGLAQFLKPLDTQTTAQFIWDLTWTLAENSGQPTTALQDLKIDYEVGDPLRTLQWCPVSLYAADGTFKGVTKAPTDPWPAGVTDQSSYDGMQFACVLYREAQPKTTSSSREVFSHDRVYVVGDATMRH